MAKKDFAGLKSMVTLVDRLLHGSVLTTSIIERDFRLGRAAARRRFDLLAKLHGIITEPIGRERGIKLPTLLQRQPTGPAEVAAACLMSSLASALPDTKMKRSIERIRGDVVSRSRKAHETDGLERKFWFVVRGGEAALPGEEVALADVIDAILAGRALIFDYMHFGGDVEKKLKVQPLTLALHEHQFYVVSKRPDGRFYPYRFARMSNISTGGKRAYPSAGAYDPGRMFQNVFGIFIAQESPIEDVSIRLRPTWRHYVESHRWHDTQTHEIAADGSVLVRLKVRICHELRRWILWFGADAEVVRPPSLRAGIASEVAATSQVYRGMSSAKRSRPRKTGAASPKSGRAHRKPNAA